MTKNKRARQSKLAKVAGKLLTAGATIVVLFSMIIGAPIYLLIAKFRPNLMIDGKNRDRYRPSQSNSMRK